MGREGGTSSASASATFLPPPSAARAACLKEICAELIAAAASRTAVNISRVKQQAASRHGLSRTPKLIEIIAALPEAHRARLTPFLRTKPVRSASGVAVVAVMCKPHRCPHVAFTGAVIFTLFAVLRVA